MYGSSYVSGITLPSSWSVPSAFWEMLNWGVVDRILWMGVFVSSDVVKCGQWNLLTIGVRYLIYEGFNLERTARLVWASPMVHTASPTVHTASPMVYTASTTVNTASTTVNTASSMVHTASTMVHTPLSPIFPLPNFIFPLQLSSKK
jgi:hypothetical protein